MAACCGLLITGVGLGCPIKTATGFDCPACGITRGTLAVFKADPVEALNFNPLLPVLWILIAAIAAQGWSQLPNRLRVSQWSLTTISTVISVLVLFIVLRNV